MNYNYNNFKFISNLVIHWCTLYMYIVGLDLIIQMISFLQIVMILYNNSEDVNVSLG